GAGSAPRRAGRQGLETRPTARPQGLHRAQGLRPAGHQCRQGRGTQQASSGGLTTTDGAASATPSTAPPDPGLHYPDPPPVYPPAPAPAAPASLPVRTTLSPPPSLPTALHCHPRRERAAAARSKRTCPWASPEMAIPLEHRRSIAPPPCRSTDRANLASIPWFEILYPFFRSRRTGMTQALRGKRVAILATEGFEQVELTGPREIGRAPCREREADATGPAARQRQRLV